MDRKHWNGYPISRVMRSMWQAGWDSTKITTFFVKAGIHVSTNTINTERHKLKTGASPANLTSNDWQQIEEIMGSQFAPPRKDLAKELYGSEEETESEEEKPKAPTVDLSKLTNLLSLFKTELSSKLDIIETKLLEQDELDRATDF